MFYLLASIFFLLWLVRLVTTAHLTALHVCVSNASDTEFRLSISFGNEMDMDSLMLSISK